MESEKVKEIKNNLNTEIKLAELNKTRFTELVSVDLIKDILTLINELESENERYKQSCGAIGQNSLTIINQLKDRIDELEEALLDMVVQFCQMGKEGYLHHTFMSAEENAFDVLDIEYGEKVDDVYKRFNERWGKKDGE